MTLETVLSMFLGIGLAASVGFRVFLPLIALSLASYFNVWELNESWLWIGRATTAITAGIEIKIEIIAYCFGYIHLLILLLNFIKS